MLLFLLACRPDKPEAADTGSGDTDTDTDTDTDADGDGYPDSLDCDDTDGAVHPDAVESCNDADDDCDGEVDEGAGSTWYVDADGDGYTSTEGVVSCDTAEEPASGGDCDDSDFAVHPDALEAYGDVQDFDCDGWTAGCELDEVAHARILGDTRYYAVSDQMDVAGDIDGDGRADLLLGAPKISTFYDGNDGSLSIFSGAQLEPGADLSVSGDAIWTIQDDWCGGTGDDIDFADVVAYVGDLDGGGGDDFIAVSLGCEGLVRSGVALFRGESFAADGSMTADPTVLLTEEWGLPRHVSEVGSGDFDGDGFGDAIVAGDIVPVLVLSGAGSGEWGDGRTLDSTASGSIECTTDECWTFLPEFQSDFNGDGQDDIVYSQGGSVYVSLHAPSLGETEGDADVSILREDTWLVLGSSGDIDGDGRADLTLGVGVYEGEPTTYVYAGATLGSSIQLYDWSWQIPDASASASGDFDGDGIMDLVVAFSDYPTEDPATWIVSGLDVVAGADPAHLPGPYLGAWSCGPGTDVDGDGFDDALGCFYGEYDYGYDDNSEEYYILFGG